MRSYFKVPHGTKAMRHIEEYVRLRKTALESWIEFSKKYGANDSRVVEDFGCLRALCFDKGAPDPKVWRVYDKKLKNSYTPSRKASAGKRIAAEMERQPRFMSPFAWSAFFGVTLPSVVTLDCFDGTWVIGIPAAYELTSVTEDLDPITPHEYRRLDVEDAVKRKAAANGK